MKITPIQQRGDSDCGPTCLYMTSQYFGLPHSYEHILTVSHCHEKDGLTNQDLVATLKELSVPVQEMATVTWEELVQANTSDQVIIVSWMKYGYMGHFSVVDTVTEDRIVLADPESGTLETVEKIVFMRLWMDYDDLWFPEKNTDIQLRWMCVVSKAHNR